MTGVTESAESRTAFLRERCESAAHGPTAPVPYRQDQIDLLKIEVPISFPLYRLQSGRTHRAQARYIEEHGLASDFFDDPESEDAQKAQHEILSAMIDEAGLREDLLSRDQRDPLVLTSDGFIVDGNRRTAALREQGEAENVVAVVLPEDALASDFYRTELELQMARQTKAKYNWIDEALHVRLGRDELGEEIAGIARRINRTESDVEKILTKLNLVDLYLDWLGEPGMYHHVPASEGDAAEQSFTDLDDRERRPRFGSLPPLQQRAVRQACFVAVHERQGYEVVRKLADSLMNRPEEVVERLKSELPEELGALLDEPATETPEGSGLLDELAQVDEADAPGSTLLNVVDGPEHSKEVAPAIKQVLDDLTELDNEQREQAAPLRKVERALRALHSVELDADTPQLTDISQNLSEIIEVVERLAERIDSLRSED